MLGHPALHDNLVSVKSPEQEIFLGIAEELSYGQQRMPCHDERKSGLPNSRLLSPVPAHNAKVEDKQAETIGRSLGNVASCPQAFIQGFGIRPTTNLNERPWVHLLR